MMMLMMMMIIIIMIMIIVFLFELFDEAKKTGNPAEAHWGLLNQDGTPKLGLTEFVLPPSFSATKP